MPPKKAPMKKKPVKKKPAKKIVKKPATSLAVPHTQGRSEFAPSAYSASREKPLGGVIAKNCHGAHAGIPGSVNLQPLWVDAMKETYGEHVSAWSDYVSDKSNCWHLFQTLHDMYDANNEEEDEKTNMIAFLPTMKLPVEVRPRTKCSVSTPSTPTFWLVGQMLVRQCSPSWPVFALSTVGKRMGRVDWRGRAYHHLHGVSE